MDILETIAIRIGWVAWALDARSKPELCPPECNEGHSYLWPCRARIKRPKKSTVGAHHDRFTDKKTPRLDLGD